MTSPAEMARSREHVLLAYIADLELEVDRLRKQSQYLHQAIVQSATAILDSRGQASEPGAVHAAAIATQLMSVADDLRESPGYHPAHDQVVAIAIRPLIEQVFKWQQRLHNAPYVALRLELGSEHIDWFPARFRHILDNLLSNALRFRDAASGESRVTVALSSGAQVYELRVADNGTGMSEEPSAMSELFYRSAPARSAGIGVGLAVVRVLLEQSGGSLEVQSGDGVGTTVVATLPKFGLSDFLDAAG
jgi:signal transduction histidine kinase